MTDRELLELAAKAAGMTLGAWSERRLAFMYRDASPGPGYWNPLTDSGQALELAVKLGLCFARNFHGDRAVCFGGNREDVSELFGSDPYAATRRAIVRAAAEIGRAL